MPYQTQIGEKKKEEKKRRRKKNRNGGGLHSLILQLLFRTVEVLGSILAAVGLTLLVWTEDWTEGLVHRLSMKSVGPVYFGART